MLLGVSGLLFIYLYTGMYVALGRGFRPIFINSFIYVSRCLGPGECLHYNSNSNSNIIIPQ